jgi:hypothetical protein
MAEEAVAKRKHGRGNLCSGCANEKPKKVKNFIDPKKSVFGKESLRDNFENCAVHGIL